MSVIRPGISSIILISVFVLSLQNSSTAFADVNEQVRDNYYEIKNDAKTQKKDGLNALERQHLFTYVVNHKVAALTDENIKKYDPTEEVGYCYGRSTAVHLRARRMGLKPEAIKNLFIVGKLKTWRFHVTTLVRGSEDKKWYAIDPILVKPDFKGTPLLAADWIKTVRAEWDPDKLAKLYLVDADTIVPDIRVFPFGPADESNDRLIEISFDPSKKEGFSFQKAEGWYELSAEQQETYFLRAKESVDTEQFDFTGLKLTVLKDGEKIPVAYDYHKYFQELVDDIRVSVYPNRRRERRLGIAPQGTEIHLVPEGTEIHASSGPNGTEIHKKRRSLFSPMPNLGK